MPVSPRNTFRRAAALLALPLIQFAPATAWGQVAAPSDELSTTEPMPILGARPIVAMGGTALSQGGRIRTFEGSIDPLGGRIRTFSGDLEPFIGRIRTFEGNIDAYGGRIRTFEGDIDPYGGRIRTFWGDLTPAEGELDPKIGRIRTFSDEFVPFSEATLELWAASNASGDFAPLAAELGRLEQSGAALWGSAVQQQTGKSFVDGFSQPFFAKWGVDLSNPQTLAGWSAFDRQRLMLDWYDNALLFSGMDRVDHWMNAVNWTPQLTQNQGSGTRATIGLIDFFVASDADVRSKVVYSGGYQNVDESHGAAVGSLMVGSHDGRGVMGIAPRASVAAYNPFDDTYTASWADVRKGIVEVARRGASVINLSLGVPGYTLPDDWRNVFRNSEILKYKDKAIYVIAAGNDGVAQSTNINMKDAFDNTFIVVGSVDPNGQISDFSNTPGTACLTEVKDCKNRAVWTSANKDFRDKSDYLKESGLLMNRFIVAPGEMILVSDGNGGVTRMSGTSFAAPLVSGAIALLHDRWPWLKNHPRDVAKIILESAQDLGAPGVDPIYGHGLLDIEKAQSALDFNKLKYYINVGGRRTEVGVAQLRQSAIHASWSTADMYFTAFEQLDNVERDFLIPLSSRLFGASLNGQQFQEYMYHALVNWLGASSYAAGFSDSASLPVMTLGNGWNMAMHGRTVTLHASGGAERLKLMSSVELSNPERGVALGFGTGDGAMMLGGSHALGMSSDFNSYLGGGNPLLGFASGDAHVSGQIGLARGLKVTVGVTGQDRSIGQDLASGTFDYSDRLLLRSRGDYKAEATTARLDYRPADAVTFSASYTRLEEQGAFFGVRSLTAQDFGQATISDGLTLSVDAKLGGGLFLFATGTGSVSNSAGDAAMGIDRAYGTAFQAGFAQQGLFGESDHLRVTLAQPLMVERGFANMKMVGVVDRDTGEKGMITQRVAIGSPEQRRYRLEAFYGTDLLQGIGKLGLFGSAELRDTSAEVPAFTAGGNMKLAF